MPCFYPAGEPNDWCERHARDHAMVQMMRAASPQPAGSTA